MRSNQILLYSFLTLVGATELPISGDALDANKQIEQPEIRVPYFSRDIPSGLFTAIKRQYPNAEIAAFISAQQKDPNSAWYLFVDLGVNNHMYIHTAAWGDNLKFQIDGQDASGTAQEFKVLSQGATHLPSGVARPSEEWHEVTMGYIFEIDDDAKLDISGVLLGKFNRSIEFKGSRNKGWSISFQEVD